MIDHNNLEEFDDPVNYDLEEKESSRARIEFYAKLAHEIGGSALDVACGTGLVALPVAALGIEITGIDLARPMLAYARTKAQRQNLHINLIEADARNFHFGKQFSFIYITGNAFQAFLQRKDQERFLACVRRHLAPNGFFVFETRNPSGHDLSNQLEEEDWLSYRNVQGQNVRVTGTQHFDALTRIMHWTTYRRWNDSQGERTIVTRIACRFTDSHELKSLLQENGFQIIHQYGDWNKSEFSEESHTIISICQHKGSSV